jgi:hypothetical protein
MPTFDMPPAIHIDLPADLGTTTTPAATTSAPRTSTISPAFAG